MAMSRGKRQRKRGVRQRASGRPPRGQPSEAEREFEGALAELRSQAAEIRARASEAQSPDTPSERVAAILVEDFEGMPAPVDFTDVLAEQGIARARAVAVEVARRAPGSLVSLTLDACR